MAQIDTNLYSRQLYAIGKDAMESMNDPNTKILICGMDGLGNEIAKNCILAGFQSITLHDNIRIVKDDLSSHYYIDEDDIDKNSVEACIAKLRELNPNVTVEGSDIPLSESFIKQFKLVIINNYTFSEQIKINDFCHKNGIYYIGTHVLGLAGYCFSDFGENFVVNDVDGEQPKVSIIEKINYGLVKSVDPHRLHDGDSVKFFNVPELADKVFKIRFIDKHSFRINSYAYAITGEFILVKEQLPLKFKTLAESLKNPDFILTNFKDFERSQTLHECFKGIDIFKSHPTFEEFRETIKESNNLEIIEKFYATASGAFCPTSSVIGGIAAHEAIKAISHKYTPNMQWVYFDAFDCLPDDYKDADRRPMRSRYDGQIAIFGREFQKKLEETRIFLVGAGAIGCEQLKNLAMMGVGEIVVTDMDTIEKSNLNRQFLFKQGDIDKPKSVVAAKAAMEFNPYVKIRADLNRVGVETEKVYDSEFYDGVTLVMNALDNVAARQYMDGRCLLFKKYLVESGTLGTKGNVQAIIPGITESYNSTQDPPEEAIPICTIKNFPNKIEHCIQWARERFDELFVDGPKLLAEHLANGEKAKSWNPDEIVNKGGKILNMMRNIPKSYIDCIKFAVNTFNADYFESINNLIEQFPPGKKTEEGANFWSAEKRCPSPISYSITTREHLNYFESFANLWANVFGIKPLGRDYIEKFDLGKIKIEPQIDELDEKQILADLAATVNVEINPHVFEKDDDTNFHIAFITAASNIRATNYGIETANMHETKGIAGRIIPALITTTATVAGLAVFEAVKMIQGVTKIEQYNDWFINLGIASFNSSEPLPVRYTKYRKHRFSIWDSYLVDKPMTLEEFIDHFDAIGLPIDWVNYGSSIIYSALLGSSDIEQRRNMSIRDIITSMKGEIDTKEIVLTIILEDEDPDNWDSEKVDDPITLTVLYRDGN